MLKSIDQKKNLSLHFKKGFSLIENANIIAFVELNNILDLVGSGFDNKVVETVYRHTGKANSDGFLDSSVYKVANNLTTNGSFSNYKKSAYNYLLKTPYHIREGGNVKFGLRLVF